MFVLFLMTFFLLHFIQNMNVFKSECLFIIWSLYQYGYRGNKQVSTLSPACSTEFKECLSVLAGAQFVDVTQC